jgi:hypothetical protein
MRCEADDGHPAILPVTDRQLTNANRDYLKELLTVHLKDSRTSNAFRPEPSCWICITMTTSRPIIQNMGTKINNGSTAFPIVEVVVHVPVVACPNLQTNTSLNCKKERERAILLLLNEARSCCDACCLSFGFLPFQELGKLSCACHFLVALTFTDLQLQGRKCKRS